MQRFERGHYASLDASELPAFLTALETTSGNIMVNFAVRLLMLTGLRPGELRKGEWREIDLDNALWEIPAERMKARRPHLVPLAPLKANTKSPHQAPFQIIEKKFFI